MYFNYWTILVGRFIFGFATGSISSTVSRYIEETIPAHLFENLQPVFCFSQTFGGVCAYMLGEFLPKDKDVVAMDNTEIWRVFYFYFPATWFALAFLSLVFTIKYDSIKNLVTKNEIKEAKAHLRLVYKNCNDSNIDTYVAFIASTCGKATSNLTITDALMNPKYRRATWVNVGYIVFHELTGINVILQFSNQIFTQMHDSGSSLTPRTGTYITGFANMFGALLSCYVVKFFNRRTLLIWGHLGIAVVHASIAVFSIEKINDGVLIMVVVFLFVYENSSGPIAWLYAAETVIDTALGICLLTLWGTVFVLSLVCPILMGKDSIG